MIKRMTDKTNIIFALMRPSDAEEVGALARRIWLEHYIAIISREQIEYMLARGYSREALEKALAEGQSILLAKHNSAICGFLGISPLAVVGNPLLRGEASGKGGYFLHRLYLAPELHGKGVGKLLFAEMLKRMPQVNLIRLQVNRENTKAHRFYQRQGFEIVEQADFDIGGGFKMQDYIMQWKKPAGRICGEHVEERYSDD